MKDRIFVAVFLTLVVLSLIGLTINMGYLIISNQVEKNQKQEEQQVDESTELTELTYVGEFSEDGEFIKSVVSQMGYVGELSEHTSETEDVPNEIVTDDIKIWWELFTGVETKYITFKDYQIVFEN